MDGFIDTCVKGYDEAEDKRAFFKAFAEESAHGAVKFGVAGLIGGFSIGVATLPLSVALASGVWRISNTIWAWL